MNESVERVRDALAELIKAALISDDATSLACREAGRAKLAALGADPPDAGEPAHGRRLDAGDPARPRRRSSATPRGQVNLTLPRACPFALDELIAPGFDVDRAVERIRKSASTG